MKYMELIIIRIAEKDLPAAEERILQLIKDMSADSRVRNIKFYHNAQVVNDLCITLHWEKAAVDAEGSATGLCLVHLLKKLGMVNHSVWQEE